MTGNEVALDTNQAIAVLSDRADMGRWLEAFDGVYLPVPVVGELRHGALNSRRPTEEYT
jgi:predicted nucleic acid-binding protein